MDDKVSLILLLVSATIVINNAQSKLGHKKQQQVLIPNDTKCCRKLSPFPVYCVRQVQLKTDPFIVSLSSHRILDILPMIYTAILPPLHTLFVLHLSLQGFAGLSQHISAQSSSYASPVCKIMIHKAITGHIFNILDGKVRTLNTFFLVHLSLDIQFLEKTLPA